MTGNSTHTRPTHSRTHTTDRRSEVLEPHYGSDWWTTHIHRTRTQEPSAAAGRRGLRHTDIYGVCSRGDRDIICMNSTVKELPLKRCLLSSNESQDVIWVISCEAKEGFKLHPMRCRFVSPYSKPRLPFKAPTLSKKFDEPGLPERQRARSY